MRAVIDTAVLLVATAGLLSASAAYLVTRRLRTAMAVLLDFLTGALLIHLVANRSWDSVLLATSVIAAHVPALSSPQPRRAAAGRPAAPGDGGPGGVTGLPGFFRTRR